ncbi:MAG TPA: hypothetical protein VK509_19730 [Polyangiales bacterium]|nr:hypothetical protein [Polyangiales bacterium]
MTTLQHATVTRSRFAPCALLAACAVLAAACGDDDEEGQRRRYTTGVGPTVTVSVLDEPQLQRICESLDVYVDAELSFESLSYIACLPTAIVLGGSSQGCKTELARCMTTFPEPIAIQAQLQDTDVCFADLRQCRATVSALERCVNVNLDLAFQILDNWSCDGAASEDLQRQAARVMNTASVCADIDASCQNFVELM